MALPNIPPTVLLLISAFVVSALVQVLKAVYLSVKAKPELDDREKLIVRFMPMIILVLSAAGQSLAGGAPSPDVVKQVTEAMLVALGAIGTFEAAKAGKV
jgi:hypothetical protein